MKTFYFISEVPSPPGSACRPELCIVSHSSASVCPGAKAMCLIVRVCLSCSPKASVRLRRPLLIECPTPLKAGCLMTLCQKRGGTTESCPTDEKKVASSLQFNCPWLVCTCTVAVIRRETAAALHVVEQPMLKMTLLLSRLSIKQLDFIDFPKRVI